MIKKVLDVAIQRNFKVKIIYQKGAAVVERIVSPRRFKGELIVCYDHFRKAQRNYKVANILAAELVSKHYDDY